MSLGLGGHVDPWNEYHCPVCGDEIEPAEPSTVWLAMAPGAPPLPVIEQHPRPASLHPCMIVHAHCWPEGFGKRYSLDVYVRCDPPAVINRERYRR